MKIAVGSQNRRTVTAHAGRTRNFSVWEVGGAGSEPTQLDWIELPRELTFHEFHSDGPHPIDVASVVIVGSAGPGFVRRVGARGITVVQTAETEPRKAVRDYLAGTLAPAAPHDDDRTHDCECGHEDHHGPGHAHGHGPGHGPGHAHGHGHGHGHEGDAVLPTPQAAGREREK